MIDAGTFSKRVASKYDDSGSRTGNGTTARPAGERHVSRQLEIISGMQARNQPTGLAKDLLFSFDTSLRAHKAHLEQLTSN